MAQSNPSKSEIDRLGNRLRDTVSPDDLRMLHSYRLSFAAAYIAVLDEIRTSIGVAATGRPAKSTTAIVDKLRRESIRLSQMQDIAGCRIVVDSYARQEALVNELTALFSASIISDRRKHPSHGYRAVHLIVPHDNRFVEVQVRTELQHLWAELSEKLADKFGIDVKYGGGPKRVRAVLDNLLDYEFIEVAEHVVKPNELAFEEIQDRKKWFQDVLTKLLSTAKEDDDFLG